MSKISCIIVDDEPLAIELLEKYVVKTPALELKAKFSNAIEALEMISHEKIQLVFLDIQMSDLSGIELSRIIGKETRVIFTTAFDHYALEGYKVNALDYLLKPFNYEEFLKSVEKAREWFSVKQQPVGNVDKYIFVKSEYRQLKIDLDKVLCFEGLKDYLRIWLEGSAKPVLTLMTLKSLEAELPEEEFMRVHRSYIVSLKKIQSIERNHILVSASLRIPIAVQYRTAFQEFLSKKSI